MIQLLLLFILSHLIADFVLQPDYIIKRKNEYWNSIKLSKGITEHVLHHLVITLIIVISFYGYEGFLIPSLIIIGVCHYIIDIVKTKYSDEIIKYFREKNSQEKNIFHYIFEKNTVHFLLDQLLHLLSIYVVLLFFQKTSSVSYIYINLKKIIFDNPPISDDTKIILLFIFIILLTFGSGYLIEAIFKDIKKNEILKLNEIAATLEQNSEDDELRHIQSNLKNIDKNLLIEQAWEIAEQEKQSKKSIKIQYQNFNEPDEKTSGKYIGYLERFLIAIFVVIQAYPALALLAAFKTLTRFKQLESKSFAEYYLIGTLLSMVFGVLIGGLIKIMIIN